MNPRFLKYAVCILVPVMAIALSYNFMSGKKNAAYNAKLGLQRCEQIADNMKNLQQQPHLAADREHHDTETTSLIEQAANSAGINPAGIVRITPQPPRRITKTSYKEKNTAVVLKQITLEKLVNMMTSLRSKTDDLKLKSITLIAPNPKDTNRDWNVELVLSYLIYDPIEPKKKDFLK